MIPIHIPEDRKCKLFVASYLNQSRFIRYSLFSFLILACYIYISSADYMKDLGHLEKERKIRPKFEIDAYMKVWL